MERYAGAVQARERLQARSGEWGENVRTLQVELATLNQDIVEGSESLSASALDAKRDSIATKERELARYARAVRDKGTQLEQELMEPVYAELNARIKDFGRERGYDIIWGTVAGGNILYAREGEDLTEALLEFLKAES